jgi:hypothetical protein
MLIDTNWVVYAVSWVEDNIVDYINPKLLSMISPKCLTSFAVPLSGLFRMVAPVDSKVVPAFISSN